MTGTGHLDTFVRDSLPPPELGPDCGATAALGYPDRLNGASAMLDLHVEAGRGDRPCLIGADGVPWSYRDLLERSNRIASVLVEDEGFVAGNRVLLRGANTPMLVACWLATLKAGGVIVPTDPELRTRELEAIVRKAEIGFAFCDARLGEDLELAAARAPVLQRIIYFGRVEEGLELLMSRREPDFEACRTAADDPALIAFTPGTRSEPLAAVHFHRDLLAAADSYVRDVLPSAGGDLFCAGRSLATTLGRCAGLLMPLRLGAASLMLEDHAVETLAAAVATHRPNLLALTPTMYEALAAEDRRADLSSLRHCLSGGERLPASTFATWQDRMRLPLLDCFGTSELLGIVLAARPGEERAGWVGRVVRGYEAVILDEAGSAAPLDQPGLLALRGPTGCRYLDDVACQRERVRDGWTTTGDLASIGSGGAVVLHGRADTIVIANGHKIAPVEVEAVLLQHEAVAKCAAVPRTGERTSGGLEVYVVLEPGIEPGPDLQERLADHVGVTIAPYKRPLAVEFVDVLPRPERPTAPWPAPF